MTEFDQFLSPGQHFDAGLLFGQRSGPVIEYTLEQESFARLWPLRHRRL